MIIYDIGLVLVCITTCFFAFMCVYTLKSFIDGHNSTKTYILMPVWLVLLLDKYLLIEDRTYWYKKYRINDGVGPVLHALFLYFMYCVVINIMLWFLWWLVLLVFIFALCLNKV